MSTDRLSDKNYSFLLKFIIKIISNLPFSVLLSFFLKAYSRLVERWGSAEHSLENMVLDNPMHKTKF
jgi:hypothetical protein